jgi:hypothetical protein
MVLEQPPFPEREGIIEKIISIYLTDSGLFSK